MTPLKSSRRRLVLNGSLAALVLAGAGVAYATVGPATSAGAATTRTSPVQRGTVIASVSASGNLALAATSSLAFGASGKVSEIDVKVGQTVTAGQVLAKIDPTQADLQLTEAQQQLTVARDNLAKAQNGPSSTQIALNNAQLAQDEQAVSNARQALSADEALPQCPSTSSTSSTSSASSGGKSSSSSGGTNSCRTSTLINQDKQAVTNAENTLALLKAQQANSAYVDPGTVAQDQEAVTQAQAAVNSAQSAVAGTVIAAPSKGTVLSIAGLVGSSVSAGSTTTGAAASSASGGSGGSSGSSGGGSSGSSGSTGASGSSSTSSGSAGFITMADLSQLQVTADVTETDVSAVQIGQSATVTLNATGKSYPAQVALISPTSTVVSNVVEYAVTLDLTESVPASVRPGQSASISIVTGEAGDTLYVPNSAIMTFGGRSIVTVVGSDGKQTVTPVTTGIVGTTNTQIISGLTQGEKVLLTLATGSSTTGRGFGGFGGGFGGGGAASIGGRG